MIPYSNSRRIAAMFAGVSVILVVLAGACARPAGAPAAITQGGSSQPSYETRAYETRAYETRTVHDPNGIGKFYMGREIAQVMGPGGIPWLDRPQREDEERPELVLKALDLRAGQVVADLGAGSGYYTFRMAPRVGKAGKVLAVEIQDEMIATLRQRAIEQKMTNVEVIQGTESDPRLPAGGVDLVLMVDVYHELAWPYEVMMKVRNALKPGGRVVFVEFRKEDPHVEVKEVHKMSVAQLEKEMQVVGLKRLRAIETLPKQHIVIFEKAER